jgi:hypothetical protein
MNNIINTGKFIFQHQFNKHFPVRIEKYRDLILNSDFTIYKPVLKNIGLKASEKVILAFHGMTMLGMGDPKFVSLCKSLSGCGYTVIAPQIDSMQNLQIEASSITNIIEMINIITNNKEMCPEGRLSILAASFAGGISLMASSDEKISGKINSICLIGSFSNIDTSINYLLSSQQSDDYGRLIILKNFLKYSIDVPYEITEAFDIALSDNFFKREEPELPAYFKKLTLRNYDLIIRLFDDPYFRLYHWNRIKKNGEFEQICSKFSMDNSLNKITASILIIHGIYDNVIPPLESVRLYNELQKIKIDSKLILTPLMSHSDLKINVNVLPSVIDLIKGLSFYFSAV